MPFPLAAPLITGGIGLLGQIISSMMSKNKKGTYGSQPTMIPEQQNMFKQFLQNMPMQEGFDVMKQQLQGDTGQRESTMRDYRENIMPEIAERFAGTNSTRSSAFDQAMLESGERLASNLNAQQTQGKQNALGMLSNMMGQGFNTRSTFPTYKQPQQSMGQSLAPMFGDLFGSGLSMLGKHYLKQLLDKTQGNVTPGPYGSSTQGTYNPYTDQTN